MSRHLRCTSRRLHTTGAPATPAISAVVWLTVVWVALWGELSASPTSWAVPGRGRGMRGVPAAAAADAPAGPSAAAGLAGRALPRQTWSWPAPGRMDDAAAASPTPQRRDRGATCAPVGLRAHRRRRDDVAGPGSLVVEARRSTHTLFLHVLDVRDQAGVDEMRRAGARPRAAGRPGRRRRDPPPGPAGEPAAPGAGRRTHRERGTRRLRRRAGRRRRAAGRPDLAGAHDARPGRGPRRAGRRRHLRPGARGGRATGTPPPCRSWSCSPWSDSSAR